MPVRRGRVRPELVVQNVCSNAVSLTPTLRTRRFRKSEDYPVQFVSVPLEGVPSAPPLTRLVALLITSLQTEDAVTTGRVGRDLRCRVLR